MSKTSSIAEVVKRCKLGGTIKMAAGALLAGIAAKVALDGAAQYGYSMGAESAGHSAWKFIERAKKEGLDDDAIERCCEATYED
jgi:tetrahydromethanopterin S-methyltransferase subunit H